MFPNGILAWPSETMWMAFVATPLCSLLEINFRHYCQQSPGFCCVAAFSQMVRSNASFRTLLERMWHETCHLASSLKLQRFIEIRAFKINLQIQYWSVNSNFKINMNTDYITFSKVTAFATFGRGSSAAASKRWSPQVPQTVVPLGPGGPRPRCGGLLLPASPQCLQGNTHPGKESLGLSGQQISLCSQLAPPLIARYLLQHPLMSKPWHSPLISGSTFSGPVRNKKA